MEYGWILTTFRQSRVILRVQMRLMLWAMDIVRRKRDFNIDGDYMSKLALDTRFDPLLSKYLTYAAELRSKYPASNGETKEEHWPGYQTMKRKQPKEDLDFLSGVKIDGVPVDQLDGERIEASHLIYLCEGTAKEIMHCADSFSIHPIKYHCQITGTTTTT